MDICEREGNKFIVSILPTKLLNKLKENISINNSFNIWGLNEKDKFKRNEELIKEINEFNELNEQLIKENEWRTFYLNLQNLELLKNSKKYTEEKWKVDEKIKEVLERINLFNAKMDEGKFKKF